MYCSTHANALLGIDSAPILVEAYVERGLPRFTIVGLRETDAREAKERIRCGLQSVGIELPLQRVTVSLAPADLPKAGASFDLPITLAILGAMGDIAPARLHNVSSHGELGLDGTLREVQGSMSAARRASRDGRVQFIVSKGSAGRAAHAPMDVRAADSLSSVIAHFRKGPELERAVADKFEQSDVYNVDLSDVRGQQSAVAALTVAAAGGHNILFYGPPGCGKTMLSQRLATLMPPLEGDEALEVATIHDAAGTAFDRVTSARPFRSPHHNASIEALVGGGGARATFGELCLAHRGVLFLDELPEFRPSAIDSLRGPLEDGYVVVRRARWVARYPCQAHVVASMNLCRCGNYGSTRGAGCTCSNASLAAYRNRVSGAILDRFDLHVRLDRPAESVAKLDAAPTSDEVRSRVQDAWQRQQSRWSNVGNATRNAHISQMTRFRLTSSAEKILAKSTTQLGLSGRSQRAIMRVAQTMADLESREDIDVADIAFALSMRMREDPARVEAFG